MGRKLKLALIEKKKSRILNMKKRKDTLTKKMHELTTLCGLSGCMIIHSPDQHTTSMWPPENPLEIRRLIDAYNKNPESVKSFGVSDFLSEVEGGTKYPSWHHCLTFMDESQLRKLAAYLHLKAHILRSKIQFLNQQSQSFAPCNSNFIQFCGIDPATAVDAMRQEPSPNNLAQLQESSAVGFTQFPDLDQETSQTHKQSDSAAIAFDTIDFSQFEEINQYCGLGEEISHNYNFQENNLGETINCTQFQEMKCQIINPGAAVGTMECSELEEISPANYSFEEVISSNFFNQFLEMDPATSFM